MKVMSLSRVRLFVTPWTVACSSVTGFSRQDYWSGLPFPSAGNLPNLGIKPRSPALKTDALPSEPLGKSQFQVIFVSILMLVMTINALNMLILLS